MKTIKHVSELPDWFDLKKYDSLDDLSLRGWWCQVETRTFLTNRMQGTPHKDDLQWFKGLFAPLKDSPVRPYPDDLESIGSIADSGAPAIKNLTTLDVYTMSQAIDDKEWGQCENAYKILSNNIHARSVDFPEISHVQNESEYSVCYPDGNLDFLAVNLNAPNDLVIKEFKAWLKNKRKNRELGKSKNLKSFDLRITEAELKKWCTHKILPYIDLAIWGHFNSTSIPQHVLGEVLFPGLGFDTTEKVRNSTKPLAEKVFTNDMNSKIAFQLIGDENR